MYYVGIDYHKRYSHLTAVNQEGDVVASEKLDNNVEILREFFRGLGGKSQAVLEASRTWGVMYDLVEGLDEVESVTLAHPLKVRAIAEAKVKTDEIDAGTLAQLLRGDLIPAAYIPRKETRHLKELIRQRVFLVRMRVRVKNRIHLLLDRLHIPAPQVSDLFGTAGVGFLKQLKLEGVDKEILEEDLKLLEVLNGLIHKAEKEIKPRFKEDDRVKLLKTIPGLGEIFAPLVALEIDRIQRFRSASKLAAYAGLVPSTYSSGGKTYNGRLIKMSNKWLRWAFVEAAWIAMRVSPYCRTFYRNRKQKKGTSVAITALARRLCEIVWHVLSEERSYEERPYQPKIFEKEQKDKPTPLPSHAFSLRGSLQR